MSTISERASLPRTGAIESPPGWDVVGPVGDVVAPPGPEPLAAAWTVDELLDERASVAFVADRAVAEPLAAPPVDPPPPPPEPEPEPEPTVEVEVVVAEPEPEPVVVAETRPIAARSVTPRRRRGASVGRRIAAAIELVVLIVLAAVALAASVAVVIAGLAFALRRAVGP